MTDSTIDEHTGDTLEVGPSAEELFGPLEDESRDDPPNGAVDSRPPETELSALEKRVDEIADRTADDVFEQVRSEAAGEYDVDSVLEEESPEEIIASADEPDESDEDAADVVGDEEGLDDLLLTRRRAGSEFLWVDTDAFDSTSDDASSVDAATTGSVSTPADATAVDESASDDPPSALPVVAQTGLPASVPELEEDDGSNAAGEGNDVETDDLEADETKEVLAVTEAGEVLETDETGDRENADENPSGLFGWLRAKLTAIF